ncbi:MAG: T9SS type A sorting domain-containing protein [Bacteroidales bacterium]
MKKFCLIFVLSLCVFALKAQMVDDWNEQFYKTPKIADCQLILDSVSRSNLDMSKEISLEKYLYDDMGLISEIVYVFPPKKEGKNNENCNGDCKGNKGKGKGNKGKDCDGKGNGDCNNDCDKDKKGKGKGKFGIKPMGNYKKFYHESGLLSKIESYYLSKDKNVLLAKESLEYNGDTIARIIYAMGKKKGDELIPMFKFAYQLDADEKPLEIYFYKPTQKGFAYAHKEVITYNENGQTLTRELVDAPETCNFKVEYFYNEDSHLVKIVKQGHKGFFKGKGNKNSKWGNKGKGNKGKEDKNPKGPKDCISTFFFDYEDGLLTTIRCEKKFANQEAFTSYKKVFTYNENNVLASSEEFGLKLKEQKELTLMAKSEYQMTDCPFNKVLYPQQNPFYLYSHKMYKAYFENPYAIKKVTHTYYKKDKEHKCEHNFYYSVINSDKGQFMGLNELDSQKIKLYPNPSSGKIQIESNEDLTNSDIYVYDLSGRIMYKHIYTGNAIDLRELAEGTYILKAVSKENVIQKKFVIE